MRVRGEGEGTTSSSEGHEVMTECSVAGIDDATCAPPQHGSREQACARHGAPGRVRIRAHGTGLAGAGAR